MEVRRMADAISIAKEGVDAFNKGDWEHARRVTASDSVYVEAATGRRTDNVEDFIALAKGWRTAFPDAKGAVTTALQSGDTAVLEITWKGTQTGPLATPSGEIPATGKKINVDAVQIVRTSGGQVVEAKHYFDLMTMLAQLGVVPAAARV
jgi:steroid delta-isomerase-like uncharacterized protein